MRILLAEDERSLSRAVCALLQKSNYSVDPVYDGREALDYLETENYPENNGVVLERYPARDLAGLIQTLSGILARIERSKLNIK